MATSTVSRPNRFRPSTKLARAKKPTDRKAKVPLFLDGKPAHSCPPRLVDLIERIKGLWPTRSEDGCPVDFMPNPEPSLPWLGFRANGCKFVDPNDANDDPAAELLALARQHVAQVQEFIRKVEHDRPNNSELYLPSSSR